MTGKKTCVTERTIDLLRQIRSNAGHSSRTQQRLDEVDISITSQEAAIMTLLKEYQELESDTGRQKKLDEVTRMGSGLDQLNELKVRLAQELSTHKPDLLYLRQRLEDELCHQLVESGQMEIEANTYNITSNLLDPSMGRSQSSQDHLGRMNERVDLGLETAAAADEPQDTANNQMQAAIGLLDAAKDGLRAATRSFLDVDMECEAQRQEFEAGIGPAWHGMSRTEFDLEQLALKIDTTRELIKAEKAYSEAGRYAVKVGFVREDSDQSCHFLDDPDDGACSNDRDAVFVEVKDMSFIEAWREKIISPCSNSSERGEADTWEVASVNFGESCSTHADAWNKVRIDRWQELREMERLRLLRAGNVACPDELVGQHSSVLLHHGLPSG